MIRNPKYQHAFPDGPVLSEPIAAPSEVFSSLKEPTVRPSATEMIPVTQPYLPPLEEFLPYLEEIWDSHQVTNNGNFHQAFEAALADYLGVKYVSLFTNGTLALLVALQALRISGEVITTPYSFVATTHSLHWNGIQPVFADIDPVTMNLDPEKVEAAITPNTSAIMPVHVYGVPCDVERLQEIADMYGLKVIYDAAHAFGVSQNGESILNHGDLSVLSFHGTKVFTTFEGGAIISHTQAMKERIDYLKNFGFANETTVVGLGINGKMNEFQAALGLLQLRYAGQAIHQRAQLARRYTQNLRGIPGLRLPQIPQSLHYNYAYYPIFIDAEIFGKERETVFETLRENGIRVRRYFYPLISNFPTYRNLPSAAVEGLAVAEKASREVICLPMYSQLSTRVVDQVVDIIQQLATPST